MKENLCFFILLIIGALFTSCDKSDTINYESDYTRSYNEWLSFKETTGNTYSYMVTGGSVFGPAWQTVITVTDGKITQRYFKITSITGLENIPKEALEWTENENELNSHNFGAATLTLDQIYDKALNEWLIKRDNAQAYFETSTNGLISSCGYVENGCMDDCFMGINIAYVKSLKL